MRTPSAIARCASGAAAIEFAVIASVLIFVCLGVIELGRGLHVRSEMAFVADLAARKVLITPDVSDADLLALAKDAFTSPRPQDLRLTAPKDEGSRTVTVQYPFSFLIPSIAGDFDITVSRRVPVPLS
jgi:Flp pilus assembly protein TadG